MRFLIVALLVAMLFLAGCPGTGPSTQGGASGGAGAQGAGTQGGALGGTAGGAGAGTSGGTGGGTQGGSASGGTEGGSQGGGTNPFANWDFAAMMALGQPVYCEVTYATEDFTGTYKYYIKGENFRVESTESGGLANAMTTIIKGKKYYMQYSQPMEVGEGKTCEWVYMDMDKITACMPEGAEAEGTTDVEDYEQAPANYNCQYGTFGDEKFATPSIPAGCDMSQQICDAYEAMAEMEDSGYGDILAACEGLEGQALQDCVQAQFGTGG